MAGPQQLYQLEIEGLPAEFPPLNTLDNRPTNLPAQPNAFIGRERELAEAGKLLARDDVRLLTLIGPGGTGKTRLALQLAAADQSSGSRTASSSSSSRRCATRSSSCPRSRKRSACASSPAKARVETLTEYLRDKELLLVLDNFEQVVAAAPALAGLLARRPG